MSTQPHHQPPPPSTPSPDDAPPFRYTARLADQIETRWQNHWDQQQTFRQPNPGEPGFDPSKPKFYCLDMFPYPSGAGLHVGHPEGYTATDIVSRHRRMKGANVLHPMGWDAFGLPAEQYAIQTGIHPAITTRGSIDTFRRQLKRFGFSYDWSREVGTIDPEFYRWTQWIFLRLYDSWFDPLAAIPAYPDGKARTGAARPISELRRELDSGTIRVGPDNSLVRDTAAPGARRFSELPSAEQRRVIDDHRLVYLSQITVNWCPALGTVLANDEVIDGRSERGGHPVLRKPLKQWQFRITSYAQRLLDDLALVDWPESTRIMQSEWIGRSEGAEIDFPIDGPGAKSLRVFTTRPDTLFGATYMVVAPEHPLVEAALKSPAPGTDVAALRAYADAAKNRAEVDRMADAKEKTGAFTGLFATNPATGGRIPIWTADYVLMSYGFGAIMAVPAHDDRDFEFAIKFRLPILDVVDSRVTTVVRYYGLHMTDAEASSGRWREVLADFLGLSVTANATPALLEEILDAVRTRRKESPDSPAPGDQPVPEGVINAPQMSGRGGIRHTWLDALEDLKLHDPRELRNLAKTNTLHAHLGSAFTGEGYAVNSANAEVSLDGLPKAEAMTTIIAWLDRSGRGKRRINFKLRDWTFARQRYWGEPIPIVFDEQGNHYPISERALPLVLPELADYSPVESDDPQPLLAKATDWITTTAAAAGVDPSVLAAGTRVRREANTMPGSAGSSWYFLRYTDARNDKRFISREADSYWMGGKGANAGVDLYIGGSEHAVGHLLYSRFWHKVLFDLGEVSTPEPFGKLFHQGMITSFAYQRPDKTLVAVDQVDEVADGQFVERATGAKLTQIVAKMSKSLKNVINPDEIIAQFGADTFRLYEMYMGPLEASKPWNTKDTIGCYRFLQRAWRMCVDEQTGALKAAAAPNPAVERQLHKTIAKVDADIPRLAFNTAIAAMIELVNSATSAGGLTKDQIERFALILAPFAPHMAEEIWSKTGHTHSLACEPFPQADPKLLVDDEVEIPVSVNGKVRTKIVVKTGLDRATLEAAAMDDEKVKAVLEGKAVKKIIAVPGKMVNVVVG